MMRGIMKYISSDMLTVSFDHSSMDILPDGANIIYSKYIPNPTMFYAVKKFDILDLVK